MAKRRKGRVLDGVVLLDKPEGISSNHALQRVKRLFQAQKAGHTGSLDPLATGMLPICFGFATKISGHLLDADKIYVVEARLGERTNTADAEGEVIETRPVPVLDAAGLEALLEAFRGPQTQVPPMYSALKIDGQRLYKLAREGVEVERQARNIMIYKLELLAFSENSLKLEVHCSKGTYIRSLIDDIGTALSCGAHVTMLRRTAVGPFKQHKMHTLEELEQLARQATADEEGFEALDATLMGADSALMHWPAVTLHEDSAYYLSHGNPVLVPKAPTEGWVRLYKQDAQFLGMGEVLDDGRVAPRKLNPELI